MSPLRLRVDVCTYQGFRDGVSEILMNFPPRVDRQLIYGGRSYLEAVHLADEIKPFIAIGHSLHARGFSAPAIHHSDLANGFLISEDFGGGAAEGAVAGIVARKRRGHERIELVRHPFFPPNPTYTAVGGASILRLPGP